MTNTDRALFRHTLATLAYRAAKALRDAPPEFASYDGAGRTPLEIVAHVGDLMEWGLSMSNGTRKWHETEPGSWKAECGRFFAALQSFDDFLASEGAARDVGEPRAPAGAVIAMARRGY